MAHARLCRQRLAHGRIAHGLAQIRPDAHGDAHPLQRVGAEHGYSLQNRRRRIARRIEQGIGDRQNLARERRVRGDQIAQLVQLHILIVGQLQDSHGDLRKRRKAKIRPGHCGHTLVSLLQTHRSHWHCPQNPATLMRGSEIVIFAEARVRPARCCGHARSRECFFGSWPPFQQGKSTEGQRRAVPESTLRTRFFRLR